MLARDHVSLDWTIDQLWNALQKELRILEAGKFVNPTENRDPKSSITSSFYTGIPRNPSSKSPPLKQKALPSCAYTNHKNNRFQKKLMMQNTNIWILAPHPIIDLPRSLPKAIWNSQIKGVIFASIVLDTIILRNVQSKNRCVNCNRKHHTSLCKKKNQPSASNKDQKLLMTTRHKNRNQHMQRWRLLPRWAIWIPVPIKHYWKEQSQNSEVWLHYNWSKYFIWWKCSTYLYITISCIKISTTNFN